jgi:hypothetical protein
MCSDDGKVTPRYPAIVWGAAFLRSVFVAGISRAASGGYKVAAFGFHVRGVAAFRLSVAPRLLPAPLARARSPLRVSRPRPVPPTPSGSFGSDVSSRFFFGAGGFPKPFF